MNNTLEVLHLNRGSEIEHSYEAKYIWRVETVEKTRDSFVDQLKRVSLLSCGLWSCNNGNTKSGNTNPEEHGIC